VDNGEPLKAKYLCILGHLVSFTAFWHILRPLVYLTAIWYIFFKEVARGGERSRVLSISFIFSFSPPYR
jgi:hypothetical protein